MSKIIYQTANGRDLISLKQSVAKLPLLKKTITDCQSNYLKEIAQNLDTLDNICELIEKSIVEEPPISVREGGMIQSGFHEKLDIYVRSRTEGKNWITELEQKEKEERQHDGDDDSDEDTGHEQPPNIDKPSNPSDPNDPSNRN